MQPSNLRLLQGLRQTNARLAAHLSTPVDQEYASTMDLVLRELISRQDEARLQGQADAAAALIEQARAAGGACNTDDVTAFEVARRERHWNACLNSARRILTALVLSLGKRSGIESTDLLRNIVSWEADVASPSPLAEPGTDGVPNEPFAATRESLQAYLERRWPGVAVEAFRRLPGGYSKVTILFETEDAVHGRQHLVLRGEQPGSPFFMDGSDVRNEFPALRYAHAHHVPVAEALWLEENATIFGGRFIVSRMASGRNYGDVFGSGTTLDEATIRELVQVLASLHRTPLDHDDPAFRASHLSKWARYRTVREFAGPYVDYWAGIAEKCLVSSPAIAHGFAWLRANLPQDETPTVMAHGDYGLHNVMIDDGKVAAILDWEASYVGDPADEFFLFAIVMSPFVDPATLIQWYMEAGGQPITEFRLRFFAVLGCLKGPIVGYGALNLSEHHQQADIKICLVGLKYVALQLNALNDAIAAAEAARDAG